MKVVKLPTSRSALLVDHNRLLQPFVAILDEPPALFFVYRDWRIAIQSVLTEDTRETLDA